MLKHVDYIAAEDTRRTGILLCYFHIKTRLISFHSYNEKTKTKILLLKLKEGKKIALVSDAGTPTINDPGYYLVNQCHKANIQIIPLPGACAAITALSASGLTGNRFCYEGFLPIHTIARQNLLSTLIYETRTLIFYEVKHRIKDTIMDMITIFGNNRYVVLARELTKKWESIQGFPLIELLRWITYDSKHIYGEMILLVEGYKKCSHTDLSLSVDILKAFNILKKFLSLKEAIIITAKLYKFKKNILYNYLLKNKI